MKNSIAGILLLVVVAMPGCTRQSVREQADLSLPLMNSTPINLNAAIAQAGAENKIVLLDFTGSDWCPPCMKLNHDVFSQPQFQSYAQSNLVFLTVDFPSKYQLPREASATNDFLAQKFDVSGFPMLIALDTQGNKIWQQVGYGGGSPKELIATLDTLKAK